MPLVRFPGPSMHGHQVSRKKKRAKESAITTEPPRQETASPTPTESAPAKTEAAKPTAPPGPSNWAPQAVRWLDYSLVVVVLLLAFLAGSFAAKNSDVWMHLATGRLIAHGEYRFGTDPFAYTTAGLYWVNRSWLADLGLYLLTSFTGGPEGQGGVVAVVVKALMVVVLAGLMLRIRRPGQSMWLPAVCVGLAILCMAPRLVLLNSMELSYLFLGITLWVLMREGRPDPWEGMPRAAILLTNAPERLYVLPPLFVLWVNCDAWFLLGPTAVALYFLGGRGKSSDDQAADSAEGHTLGLVFLGGLAACLLNPHHIFAFTPPLELLPSLQFPELARRFSGMSIFMTPFQRAYAFNGDFGGNVAGWTYYVILSLGLFSFVVSFGSWSGGRLLLWLGFALLSVSNYQLIPFFAIIAGPITALNLQDWVGASSTDDAPTSIGRWLAVGGRGATLVFGILLLLAAWPGWLVTWPTWLFGNPINPQTARHVGWGIEAEPSLVKLASQLAAWRRDGILNPDDHGLNFRAQVVNYCAWFAPGEKGFSDDRLDLFGATAYEHGELLLALLGAADNAPGITAEGMGAKTSQTLRERNVRYVILYNEFPLSSNMPPSDAANRAVRFIADPTHWTLLYLDGRSYVFGSNDLLTADQLKRLQYDFAAHAFGAKAERVPAGGPGRGPQPRTFWSQYLYGSPPRPLAADEAAVDIFFADYFDKKRRVPLIFEDITRRMLGITIIPSALMGSAATYTPLSIPAAIPEVLIHEEDRVARHFAGPYSQPAAGPLLLGLRAARRAIAEAPDDPEGYFYLYQAAFYLGETQELQWGGGAAPAAPSPSQLVNALKERSPILSPWAPPTRVSLRHQLRRIEEVNALTSFLQLRPDSITANDFLSTIYWNMGYYDLALDYFRGDIKLEKQAARSGNSAALDDRISKKEKALNAQDAQVKPLQNAFELATSDNGPGPKALAALRMGLPAEALNWLAKADPHTFGPNEQVLNIYLRLTTGHAEELRSLPGPESLELKVLQAVALGDLSQGSLLDRAANSKAPNTLSDIGQIIAFWTAGQTEPNVWSRLTAQFGTDAEATKGLIELRQHQELVGQLLLVRGLIALEEGDNLTAATAFRGSLDYTPPNIPSFHRGVATRYLELLDAHKND